MGGQVVRALAGIDLDLGDNEYAAIVGASGSGKSSLMNIIGCLDSPTAGSYTLNGRAVAGMNDTELALIRNREIGFIFQSFNLLPRADALHNVMQPLVYRRLPIAERYAKYFYSAEGGKDYHRWIASDFERARQVIQRITGHTELLESSPVIRKSILLRNPYTDVLNLLQIELIRRAREGNSDVDADELRHDIFLSINGIAAAMQSTG